ncbi:hypothetical protein ILUMI_23924 [Ignelater luminosus]|uniref:Uncharacterized protein n=1 Tax=Ignelater luminosus TaxID=2038154 RepID=A0A8K0G162_IGNLU|nr:hypothetical protein ILUMI_23924 [Ignelater luminosus]
MDMPTPSPKFYRKLENDVEREMQLQSEMIKAADEERKLAIEIEEGIPFISVIVDGGWAKRLSAAVRKAIKGSGNNSAAQLCKDLKNVPQHVFESHSKCRDERIHSTKKRKRHKVDKQEDNDYSPNEAKEDLINDEFATRKEEILRQLAGDDCDTVANDTVGQTII